MKDRSLECLFHPKTVAVIGATERIGSVGRTLMSNLLSTFCPRAIFPINPKYRSVFGKKCFPSIKDAPKTDLAVIVTPARMVPQIIAECVEAKVSVAIIISAGFKEAGTEGIHLEQEILFHARDKIRIIGPNCLGVMCTASHLNATFAHDMAAPGRIALISQSGALCTAILDWSLHEKIGFSSIVSIGSMIDVDWSDLLDYFEQDPHTRSIMIYMESIGDPARFVSSSKRVARTKPIVLIKAGRTAESVHAVISHSGALVGNNEVVSAAMQQANVLRVDSLSDFLGAASWLAYYDLPLGLNLTIVTNAGGPGVIAVDDLVIHQGKLSRLTEKTIESLNTFLPPFWSHNNPIDILGNASKDSYLRAIAIASSDPSTNAVLVILTPQGMTDPDGIAESLQKFPRSKSLFVCWMGSLRVEEGRSQFRRLGIPSFELPDAAARTFALLAEYRKRISHSEEKTKGRTPSSVAETIIEAAQMGNRKILDEWESKQVLKAWGISINDTRLAFSTEEAVSLADAIGYPVVLKVHSHTITHKMDAGGVKLNLKDAEQVQKAYREIELSVKSLSDHHFQGVTVQQMTDMSGYELFLGSTTDEQFGPIILFGVGGRMVEAVKDKAIGLPPLSFACARALYENTSLYRALEKKINWDHLTMTLISFSEMIAKERWIKECDINPLVASKDNTIAIDARIILHESN